MKDIWLEADAIAKEKNVPLEIILELTRRCNLKCCHCYNLKDDTQINLDDMRRIVPQLRRAGTLFVGLTGGEPMVHEDFLDIVALIRGAALDVKIVSNGTKVTSAIARELNRICVSDVGISLQGARPETHDSITGVSGSFQKTLDGVRLLKEAGVPVHIKCTLMKENYADRDLVAEIAEGLKVPCITDPMISPRDDGRTDVLAHRLPESQIGEMIVERLSQAEKEGAEGEALFCEAGRIFGAISASGDVYPCIQMPIAVGNVMEEDLVDIWADSDLLQKMRMASVKDLDTCSDCELAMGCYRCPGLAFLEEGDPFGPSPTACLIAKTYRRFREENHGGSAA